MYAGGQQLGDIFSDLTNVVQSGAQLVQTLRPTPVGTSPLVLPTYAPPAPQPRSMFSDPMTLALIAMGGLAVIILLIRR